MSWRFAASMTAQFARSPPSALYGPVPVAVLQPTNWLRGLQRVSHADIWISWSTDTLAIDLRADSLVDVDIVKHTAVTRLDGGWRHRVSAEAHPFDLALGAVLLHYLH